MLALKILASVLVMIVAAWLAFVIWFTDSGAMDEDFGPIALIDNRTAIAVEIEAVVIDDGGWLGLPGSFPPGRTESLPIPAGQSRLGRDGCVQGPLRALDSSGHEVATHPGPLCDGDVWTIEARDGEGASPP